MIFGMSRLAMIAAAMAVVGGLALYYAQSTHAQGGVAFYVDPRGNDAGSGSKAEPFATIAHARDAVRALKRKQGGRLGAPVTVFLHGGTYELPEPLSFTPEDSGTDQAPVTYAAYESEQPIISGGRVVRGWKPVTVNGRQLWAADIPDVREGRWYFKEIWVNGQRRYRAHAPNQGFFRARGVPGLGQGGGKKAGRGGGGGGKKARRRQMQAENGGGGDENAGGGGGGRKPKFSEGGQDSIQYSTTDLQSLQNPQDVEIVVPTHWVESRFNVDNIDDAEGIIRFKQKSHRALLDRSQVTRYIVENAMELLDSPGEWYLNRGTGVLYYWPMSGENMASAEVIAPRLQDLVGFHGDASSGKSVSYVNFRGLTFAYSEGWLPQDDIGDWQGQTTVPGMIHAEGMHNCTFDRCTLTHASNYGFQLDLGCQGNRIMQSRMTDLGGGGMMIGPAQHIKPQQERITTYSSNEETRDNQVTDNVIKEVGRIFHGSVGVMVLQSAGNLISHNDISDLYYSGISVGFTWGYKTSFANHNIIEYNRVQKVGQHWLSDMGGIYMLGTQPGSVVRNNVVSDVYSFDYGGWGMYLDQGSSQIRVENNLFYRTSQGGFHINYGQDNVLTNNIFALGEEMMVRRSKPSEHPSFHFDHNIVYWQQGVGLTGVLNDGNFEFDYNDYYTPAGEGSAGENFGWSEWQRQGSDRHSVFADPRFVDPQNGDFSLRPDSPALKLGFRSLDLKGVGPRS